jgi:hypothetical protein
MVMKTENKSLFMVFDFYRVEYQLNSEAKNSDIPDIGQGFSVIIPFGQINAAVGGTINRINRKSIITSCPQTDDPC